MGINVEPNRVATPDYHVPRVFDKPASDLEADLNQRVRDTYRAGAQFALFAVVLDNDRFMVGGCGWGTDGEFHLIWTWSDPVEALQTATLIHWWAKEALRSLNCGDPACVVHGDGGFMDRSDRRQSMSVTDAVNDLMGFTLSADDERMCDNG